MSPPAPNGFAPAAFLLLVWLLVWWKREDPGMAPDWLDSAKGSPMPAPASPTELEEMNSLAGEHMRFVYAENYPAVTRRWLWRVFWVTAVAAGIFCADGAWYILGMGRAPLALAAVAFCGFGAGLALLTGLLWSAQHRHRNCVRFWQQDRARQSVESLAKTYPNLGATLRSLDGMGLPWWWVFGINRRTWLRRLLLGTLRLFAVGLTTGAAYLAWYSFWPTVPHPPKMVFAVFLGCALSAGLLVSVHRLLQIRLSPWRGADFKSGPTFALAVLRDDFMGCPTVAIIMELYQRANKLKPPFVPTCVGEGPTADTWLQGAALSRGG